ncbi:MAG: polysaccharide pyruvyl transferase family protein [Bacteroidota bacterium]
MIYYYQVEGQVRNNIGDVLQGMAAKAFLPQGALVADREALSEMNSTEQGLFIANGWYMHSFEKFPPPGNIKPVYVSVHVANSQLLTSKKVRDHFKLHSPIGCRDTKTLKLFLGWGIPAYYSSCLTITTKPKLEQGHPKNEEIILVDNVDHPVPEDVISKLEKSYGKTFTRISHDPPVVDVDFKEYAESSEKHMESLLKRYCAATLVVTTKIHCALPCLGMGANVLFIHPQPDDPRLATIAEFIDIVSYKDILEKESISSSPVNQDKLNQRRKFLVDLVSQSVQKGYNVITRPGSDEYKSIRLKSMLSAKLVRGMVLIARKVGFKKEQMDRVYGSEI